MKILFTGGSSFTGYWFIKELVKSGHDVTSVFTGNDLEAYSGLRRERIRLNSQISTQVFGCPFGSDKFIDLIRDEGFDILCHHAAEAKDYKSYDFNVYKALESNSKNLPAILKIFRSRNFQGVILSGTFTEADEGKGSDGERLEAVYPYGLSKSLTYQYFRYYCINNGIKLAKFVLPNPFGPYEEPRFTSYLARTWLKGVTPDINTPKYVRDNMHVDLLGLVYSSFVRRFIDSKEILIRYNPSFYISTVAEFAQMFAREMRPRLNVPCEINLKEQVSFDEPIIRTNFQPVTGLFPDWDEKKSWDNLASFYLKEFTK